MSDTLADNVAAGMQRWRQAVSSTTMLLMERRMDAAVPVGSGVSAGNSSSTGRQAGMSQHDIDALDGDTTPPSTSLQQEPSACQSPVKQQQAMPLVANTLPQLQLREVLGQGSFGCVYLANWRGKRVAVKVMQLPANALLEPQHKELKQSPNQQLDADELQRRRRARQVQQNSPPHMAIMEAVVSSTMSHPNVVQVYTYMLNPLTAGAVSGPGAAGDAARLADAGSPGPSEIAGWELKLVMEYCDQVGKQWCARLLCCHTACSASWC
jgi:hypothetical protein